ncbi:MAG: sporulation protein YqfD [Oscillibacter sp.]|nr:sporulation protein YqfD [Oscillibacter sp.]
MNNRLWEGLRGQVRVEILCEHPEQVLNLCGKKGLPFRDLRRGENGALFLTLSRGDCARLRNALKGTECDIRQVRQIGFRAALSALARRQTLCVFAVIVPTVLFLGSFFVWDYDITGNETVPEERILRALDKQGVGPGSFGLSLDGEDIRNHVLLDIPELEWISVNVSGYRAHVQVRERTPPPEPVDTETPANVIARRDGLVLSVSALDGKAAVLPGTSVLPGDLLISGTESLETTGKTRVMPGRGSVRARTWYKLTTAFPVRSAEKRFTGEERVNLSVIFGTRRVKFFLKRASMGLEPETNCDKITQRTALSVFGLPLPVTLVRERYRLYETVPVELDAEEARNRGEAALRDQLETEVAPYGEVRSTLCTVRARGENVEVTLSAECVEEIGERVPIYTVTGSDANFGTENQHGPA